MFSAFICGGNWNNGVRCGARTVNLNNYPWNVNTNIGSRLACDKCIKKRGAIRETVYQSTMRLFTESRTVINECFDTVYQIADLVIKLAKLFWPSSRGKTVYISLRRDAYVV